MSIILVEAELILYYAKGAEDLQSWRLPTSRKPDLVNIQKKLMTDDLEGAIREMLTLDLEENGGKFQEQIQHQSGKYYANEKSHNHEKSKSIDTGIEYQYYYTYNQLNFALQRILNNFPGYSVEIKEQIQKEVAPWQTSVPVETTPVTEKDIYKILMLNSNQGNTGKLQLEKEFIQLSQIKKSDNPERYFIKKKRVTTLQQFTEALLDEKPAIVHFSSHGEISDQDKAIKNAMSRDLGFQEAAAVPQDSTGIILTSDDGREPAFIPTNVIKRIFRSMIKRHKISIKAVLFNSCYSEAQVQTLAELVPHVIGTSWAIKDEAAIVFANGFYSFLTRTDDIEAAWDNGVTLAMAKGEPEERFIYFKGGERVN